jgi:hypothetical protein
VYSSGTYFIFQSIRGKIPEYLKRQKQRVRISHVHSLVLRSFLQRFFSNKMFLPFRYYHVTPTSPVRILSGFRISSHKQEKKKTQTEKYTEKVEQDRKYEFKCKTEKRSSSHCCCGKPKSITYSVCVFVALVGSV